MHLEISHISRGRYHKYSDDNDAFRYWEVQQQSISIPRLGFNISILVCMQQAAYG